MSKNNFYITTTLPYVNSDPHLGHALELIRADAVARHKKMLGFSVFFNRGTDEHGIKIYNKAKENGVDVKEYVDKYAKRFLELGPLLKTSEDINFIRTTDEHHIKSAQEFWKVCEKNGDIYKKNYQSKYCIGCEMEKTDSELVNGKCPDHPNNEITIIDEENYFFRLSKYQSALLDLYKTRPDFVLSKGRMNEAISFVERGLEDFSVSRLKEKMPWGVAVPGDDKHVMYVWFDALVNYVSAIGWPDNMEKFNEWWPVVQYCGKDNLRPQAVMWQAMLASAKLPFSQKIIVDGFVQSDGQKMSKSVGNVINPYDVVKEYGAEPLRYYLTAEISSFEDGDFTMEKFKTAYNAGLANGIGNLVSRVMKMATMYKVSLGTVIDKIKITDREFDEYRKAFYNYDLKVVWDVILREVKNLDQFIQTEEPFKKVKVDAGMARVDIGFLLAGIYRVALMIQPFLPETSPKIIKAIKSDEMPEALFMRRD